MHKIQCPVCNGEMTKEGYCDKCDVVIDGTCPECGSLTWVHNDPATDTVMGTYCSNSICPYTTNQFLYWDEMREDFLCSECGNLHTTIHKDAKGNLVCKKCICNNCHNMDTRDCNNCNINK